MPYKFAKPLCILLFGLVLTYAALSHALIGSLMLIAVAISVWVFVLVSQRPEIQRLHTARQIVAVQRIRASKQPWRKPPQPRQVTGLFLFCGTAMLWATFADHAKDANSVAGRMMQAQFGANGTIAVSGLFAAFFLFLAVESALGAYLCRKRTPPGQEK